MKEWAFSICLAVISGCIVRIISPNGGMGKIINFSMSVFLLSCIFSGLVFKDPCVNLDFSINDEMMNVDERLKTLKEQKTLGAVENKLKEIMMQDLLLKGIKNPKISININTNDKSSILINQVEIFVDKGEEKNEDMIKSYIEEKYKVIPHIIYS